MLPGLVALPTILSKVSPVLPGLEALPTILPKVSPAKCPFRLTALSTQLAKVSPLLPAILSKVCSVLFMLMTLPARLEAPPIILPISAQG